MEVGKRNREQVRLGGKRQGDVKMRLKKKEKEKYLKARLGGIGRDKDGSKKQEWERKVLKKRRKVRKRLSESRERKGK